MVKHVALFSPALFVQLCCFPPALVGIDQRRPGKWLWREASSEYLRWAYVVCWYCLRFGGKHEEAQTHAIGRAGRFFIHQAHIVHGRRSQTVPDLQDDKCQAEESRQCHDPSDFYHGQMGGGELWRLPMQ